MHSQFLTCSEIDAPSPVWAMAVTFALTALFIVALIVVLPSPSEESRATVAAAMHW